MECNLCNKPIKDYNPVFHHLKIDDTISVDICPECVDKVVKWHGKVISELFPTRAMKKRFGK